jgi:hypothetical protein
MSRRGSTAKKTTTHKGTGVAKKATTSPPKKTYPTHRDRVVKQFSAADMKRVCETYELDFIDAYPELECEIIEERKTNNFYFFADHGSDILFVAHLDTVVPHEDRLTNFCETAAGLVVHSGALDDRLGAYIGLEWMPRLLGKDWADILLTVGEESGQSTAEFFDPPEGREYKWMIEFDRKGTDVVMYEYGDFKSEKLVEDHTSLWVGRGSFSDICYLNHLGIKGFNWGTGYDGNYHSIKGYAYLEDTFKMVGQFLNFHAAHHGTRLPHERKSWVKGRKGGVYGNGPKHSGSGAYGSGSGSTGWPKFGDTRWRNGKRGKYLGSGRWEECDSAGNLLHRGTRKPGTKQKYTSEHGWVDLDDEGNEILPPPEDEKKGGEPERRSPGAHDPDTYTYQGRTYTWDANKWRWVCLDDDTDLDADLEDLWGEEEFTFAGSRWRWDPDLGNYVEISDKPPDKPDKADAWVDGPCTVGGKEYPSYRDWWNQTHPDRPVDADGNWLNPSREDSEPDRPDVVRDVRDTLFSHPTR